MGKAVKGLRKTFGGDTGAGSVEMGQANAMMERAVRELEKIGIPTIEAQQIALQNPELILSSADEKLSTSAMEDMNLDPRLQGIQKQALQETMERGKTGFNPEDIARFEAMREQVAGDEQARQQSILGSMAQRGALDSGAQLAQQLSSSQGAAQRAAQASRDIAGQASQARQGALSQAANMAQNMDSSNLALQGQKASAKDRIAQFNAGVATRDTGAKQDQAQNLAQTSNQQEMYNKGLHQQNFQNQMSKATGVSNALGNQAGMMVNAAAMQANAAQQKAAGNRGMLKTGMEIGGLAMGSDKNIKKDIESPKNNYVENQIEEMYSKLEPKKYEYKDEKFGKGERAGILAQDLEKSELGKSMVIETSEGKAVDMKKATGSLLAAVAQLQRKMDKLEGKKYADGGVDSSWVGDLKDPLEMMGMGGSGGGGGAGGIMSMAPMLAMLSDENQKKNIKSVKDEGKKYADGTKYEPYNTPEYDPKYAQKLGKPDLGEQAISSVGDPINRGMAKFGSFFGDEKSKAYLAQNPEMRSSEDTTTNTTKKPAATPSSKDTKKPVDKTKALKSLKDNIDTEAPKAWKPTFSPQALQYQAPQSNGLDAIRQQIMGSMKAADGGHKMAYEDGGEGTIIPGDSYAGDKLDDNINSKEMVTNLKQQNRINQLLLELKELRGGKRVDSMVQSGEAEVNPKQQEALMAVARGEKEVEELPDENVVDPVDTDDLIEQLLALLPDDEEEV